MTNITTGQRNGNSRHMRLIPESLLEELAEFERQGFRIWNSASTQAHTTPSLLAFALDCRKRGLSCIPASEDGLKRPDLKEWTTYQQRLPTEHETTSWFGVKRTGFGLITGTVSGNLEFLDFDNDAAFLEFHELATKTGLGNLVERLYQEMTPRPGAHLAYRCETIEGNQKLASVYERNEGGTILLDDRGKQKTKTLIETRGEGGFVITYPSHGKVHPSGKPYTLVSGSLSTIPTITPAERHDLLTLARALGEVIDEEPTDHGEAHTSHNGNGTRPGDLYNARATWQDVLFPHGWIQVYAHRGVTYWRRPGKDRGISASTDFNGSGLLYVWSTSTLFTAERGFSKFSAYAQLNYNGDFKAAAEALAKAGYTTNGDRSRKQHTKDTSVAPGAGQESETFTLTDTGNAQRLVARHGADIRYCHLWKKWLVWDGTRWRLDTSGAIYQLAKATARSIATDEAKGVEDSKEFAALLSWSKQSLNAARLKAMVELAQSELGIPVQPEDFDSNPWLLNVKNGTVDLKTGDLLPHRRGDLITKLAPVRYDPDATAPTWERVLTRIFAKDTKLICFIQKAVGYSLTGLTTEQILLLLYGVGENGKSTLLAILSALLGDYAETADFTSFLHKEKDSVRNDLAKLRSARLVSAIEAEEGKRLAEVLIKQVTGSDRITARFLFSEFFDFTPTFKLWLVGNHKPIIKGTDHAIWRRIRLVPFTVRITPEERDKDLLTKLQAELPGILTWAIVGCLAWQEEGLEPPETVQAATDGYRNEMDVVGGFLEEECVLRPEMTVSSGSLRDCYLKWCEQEKEIPLTQRALATRLKERGLENERSSLTGRIQWKGIGLRIHD